MHILRRRRGHSIHLKSRRSGFESRQGISRDFVDN
jgi:hypothetical protein